MFKNKKVIAIILAIAIIAGAAGWYAYDRHQSALATEQARQEELAKAEAEKKAAEEEAAKKAEEEKKAAEEVFKTDEQGRTPLEQQWAEEKEIDPSELTAEDKAEMEALSKKYEPIMDDIEKVLVDYNRVQNEYDYRTYTGHEGEEYMTPEAAAEYAAEVAPKLKEEVTKEKTVSKFDGIEIRALVFTTDDFKQIAVNPDDPDHAYAEVEVKTHYIEPKEETFTALFSVWLMKVDDQWKIHAEKRLDS